MTSTFISTLKRNNYYNLLILLSKPHKVRIKSYPLALSNILKLHEFSRYIYYLSKCSNSFGAIEHPSRRDSFNDPNKNKNNNICICFWNVADHPYMMNPTSRPIHTQ